MEVERKANKVTVTGYVEPSKVVKRIVYRTGKTAELWPYVPYDMVAHPYDPNVSSLARASSAEVRYTTAFSDDNPAACAVM